MTEETALGEGDRTSLAVSFATATSPFHDSHGAQISSDCEANIVSLASHFLLTDDDVMNFSLYKRTPLSETADTKA
jgi:hypothetical protein